MIHTDMRHHIISKYVFSVSHKDHESNKLAWPKCHTQTRFTTTKVLMFLLVTEFCLSQYTAKMYNCNKFV